MGSFCWSASAVGSLREAASHHPDQLQFMHFELWHVAGGTSSSLSIRGLGIKDKLLASYRETQTISIYINQGHIPIVESVGRQQNKVTA